MHPRYPIRTTAIALVAFAIAGLSARQDFPMRPKTEGITNFTRLDSTVGCAGLTSPAAMPGLKQMGFVSVVNLQRPTENGADVDGERAAADAAGLKYFHLPFTTPTTPDVDPGPTVEAFLRTTGDPANLPVFVHCAGGGRAAALWMIKRVRLDGWDVAKARAEADLAYPDRTSAAINWAEKYVRER